MLVPGMMTPAYAEDPPEELGSKAQSTWQTDGIVWALASAGNKMFAAGKFSSIRPPGAPEGQQEYPRTNFAAFNATTGEPIGCAPKLTSTINQTTESVRALDVSPDGKTLYIGGYFNRVDGKPTGGLMALDIETCKPKAGFATVAPNALVHAIDSTASTVYFGGEFTLVNSSHDRHRLASVSASSGALTNWNPRLDKRVKALIAAPDKGRVIVGGLFDHASGSASHALVAIHPSRVEVVDTFPTWIESRSEVMALARDGDDFYLGAEGTGGGAFDGRMSATLEGDHRWTDRCLGATQAVLPYKGVLYSGSHAHDCGMEGEFPDGKRYHLLAQGMDDKQQRVWYPNTNGGLGEALGPRALAEANGFMWVGGEFTSINGKPQQSLTRFGNERWPYPPAVPKISGSSPTHGQIKVSWRAAWDRDEGDLTYKVFRDGEPVKTLEVSSREWDRPTVSWTDAGVQAGSTHTYQINVSNGRRISARSNEVEVTARRWVTSR